MKIAIDGTLSEIGQALKEREGRCIQFNGGKDNDSNFYMKDGATEITVDDDKNNVELHFAETGNFRLHLHIENYTLAPKWLSKQRFSTT